MKYIADVDTAYNRIQIVQTSDVLSHKPVIEMQTNGEGDSAMFNNSDDLVYTYTKYFRLAKHFNPDLKTALAIGGAGYSYPKDFLKNFPNGRIDVVEIDPGVTNLARRYFRLKNDPRLQIYHQDGRIYLNSNHKQYDVIFGDAFKSYSPPYNLTTRQAVEHMYNSLDSDGAVLMNIVSTIEGPKGEFLRSEYATYKSVFPQVYIFTTDNNQNDQIAQNIILVALKSSQQPDFSDQDPELDGYLRNIWKKPITNDMSILTDDYAPVEQYVAKILF